MEPHLLSLPAFLGWLGTLGEHSFLAVTPGRPSREVKRLAKARKSAGFPRWAGLNPWGRANPPNLSSGNSNDPQWCRKQVPVHRPPFPACRSPPPSRTTPNPGPQLLYGLQSQPTLTQSPLTQSPGWRLGLGLCSLHFWGCCSFPHPGLEVPTPPWWPGSPTRAWSTVRSRPAGWPRRPRHQAQPRQGRCAPLVGSLLHGSCDHSCDSGQVTP